MTEFYWKFEIANNLAFDRLAATVAELRAAKLSGEWRDCAYWRQVFTGADVNWGVDALVDAFQDGEFVLLGVRRDDFDSSGLQDIGIQPWELGYLDFEPFACPYSGDCIGELIEAFGHCVTGDSGT